MTTVYRGKKIISHVKKQRSLSEDLYRMLMMPNVMQMTHSYCSCCLALSGGGRGGHPARASGQISVLYLGSNSFSPYKGDVMYFYVTVSKWNKI